MVTLIITSSPTRMVLLHRGEGVDEWPMIETLTRHDPMDDWTRRFIRLAPTELREI